MKLGFSFVIYMFLFLFFVPPSIAADGSRSLSDIMRDYDSDKANAAQQEAKSYREQAEIKKRQAKEYRELADNARKYAEDTNDEKNKADWLKNAADRDKKADALEKEAQDYIKKADKLEKKSKGLKEKVADDLAKETAEQEAIDKKVAELREERKAEEAKKRNEDSCQFTEAAELIGLWQYNDDTDSNPLAIVEEDPEIGAYPNNLELHNYDRVWKGTFDSTPGLAKDKPRMVFKYQPKIEEMNKDLPDWVVVGMEGQLEWEMEIWAECEDGAVMPHALFYPGEIEWDEDNETYEIIGRGEGRRFDLNPVAHMTMESYANGMIGVSIDKKHDLFSKPIEALTKRQRFDILVQLPADMAEEVGNEIEVKIRGLENGDEDTVTLKAGKAKGNNPVLYRHKGQITIADSTDWRENPRRQKWMSLNYIFGDAGDRLDLDVENAETVEFSYKDLKFEVPVYQSMYQRGIARFEKAAERMEVVLDMAISGSENAESAEVAKKKKQMLENFRTISASEYVNDRHRYNLGEVYFGNSARSITGLLEMTEEQIRARLEVIYDRNSTQDGGDPINPLLRAGLEGISGKDMSIKSNKAAMDIVWTSDTEKFSVITSIRKTSLDSRREIMDIVIKDFSFGIYEGITSATGTDSVYLLATGTDTFGRKVPTWQRVQAAIGLGSGAILTVTGARAVQKFASKPHKRIVGVSHKSGTSFSAIRNKHTKTNGITEPGPKTLKPSQKKQTTSKAKADNLDSADNIETDVYPEHFKKARSEREAFERMFSNSPNSKDFGKFTKSRLKKGQQSYIKSQYPSSAVLVKSEIDDIAAQTNLPNCQAQALRRIIKRKTGNEITEIELHRIITHLVELEKKINPIRPVSPGYGLTRGYKNWMIRKAGRAFGFRVGEINVIDNVRKLKDGHRVTRNSAFKLRSLRAVLEAGGGVKAIIKLNGGTHAVSLEGLTINKRGFVTRVRIFDSNVPGVIEIPAVDFRKMLSSKDSSYGAITVFL